MELKQLSTALSKFWDYIKNHPPGESLPLTDDIADELHDDGIATAENEDADIQKFVAACVVDYIEYLVRKEKQWQTESE